jgi:hypothetical protein
LSASLESGTKMDFQEQHVADLTLALERQVELQADAAKRAIRDYKKALLEKKDLGTIRQVERQRELERVVSTYMQLRKRLDEVRAEAASCTA